MKKYIKIVACLLLVIGMNEQKAPAYSMVSVKPASTVIGVVAGGITTWLVFRALEKTNVPEINAVPDNALEQLPRASLEDIKDIDDIIIVNGDQLQENAPTHTIRNLIASILLGTVAGFAVKALSEDILMELCDEMLNMRFGRKMPGNNNNNYTYHGSCSGNHFEDFFNQYFNNVAPKSKQDDFAPPAQGPKISKEEALTNLGFRANENPTREELSHKFKQLSRDFHPDRFINKSEYEKNRATEEFKVINEAYEKLTKYSW